MLKDFTVSYRRNPVGLDEAPVFSWKLTSSARDVTQAEYHIVVGSGGRTVWDTGNIASERSVFVPYDGEALTPMTVYRVEVTVRDSLGELHRGGGTFETGLLSEDNLRAEWITHGFSADETACPVFSKTVPLRGKLRSARLYATACGVYEASVNGQKAGDAFLAPGWTSYKNRLQYQTYDVTGQLIGASEASVRITVGNGWYKGYLNGEGKSCFYGDRVAVLAMLRLEYEDGTAELSGTDTSWEVSLGKIRSSELYHGEVQDFTAPMGEVSHAVSFDPSGRVGKLTAQECEPVRVTRRIPAKELLLTPDGHWVIDFGQNMAGLVELTLPPLPDGVKRGTLTLRHAEALDKLGNLYTENLRTAKATDVYIYGPE